MSRRELLLGCGNMRDKRIKFEGTPAEFTALTTLDLDPSTGCDVVWDLNSPDPLPFESDTFDEIHAYEVLEHCGRQGDYKFFFRQFEDLWRILKPGGFLCVTCPMWDSPWAWGDPGHTRVITRGSLIFLDRDEYAQVGKTAMTDYRNVWHGNFKIEAVSESEHAFGFVLRAVK